MISDSYTTIWKVEQFVTFCLQSTTLLAANDKLAIDFWGHWLNCYYLLVTSVVSLMDATVILELNYVSTIIKWE